MRIFFLTLLLGLFLRLINLNQSLWLDEAISVLAARDFSYPGIIFDFLKIDNHPPLFYLVLKFWGETFGFTDWILRILPVLLGTLVIYFVYRIALKISSNKKIAITAALLLVTSPLLIYYSQEVRMYILITLLAAIQILIFLSILKNEKIWKWISFSIFNCLLFFSDYITVFLFPVFLLIPIIQKQSKLLVKVLLSFLPLGILFALWFPYFNEQLIKNKDLVDIFPGWQAIIGGATFKNLTVLWMKFVLGRISFEPKLLYYGLVGLFSIPILISLGLGIRNFKKHLLIWLWFLVPVTSGFIFSFLVPVFNYFRFIYVLPALLILVAIGFFEVKKPLIRNLLIGWVLITNVLGLSIYYFDVSQQRENWRQVVSFIEQSGTQNDLVVFEFKEEPAPYRWYSTGKINSIGATDSYFADKDKTFEKLGQALHGKTGVYYFEYLRDLSDPNRLVEQKLRSEGFQKGEIYNDFYNLGQITYWHKQFNTPVSDSQFECPNRYMTLINPIRSRDLWNDKSLKPLEDQYTTLNSKKFPATWLIQYDAMFDPELLNYLRGFNKQQELGIFLEISEKLAKDSRVIYPFGASWYFPQAVFLSGYSQSERIKLINTVMSEFKQVFGYYPKSLGSWWIDSYSLKYLEDKYGVDSYLIVADQKTTDNYGIWGQWWSVPYYPDKANVLLPGADKNKLDLIILQWAQRHPELSIGEGSKFSNNSVQPNDYISLGKDTNFFIDLVRIYLDCKNPVGQLTIGMETGAISTNFHEEYINQLEVLSRIKNLKAVTMSEFFEDYKKTFSGNPEKIVIAGKNSSWNLSQFGRENPVIGETIKYQPGTSFADFFVPDKSGFLERDLTKLRTLSNNQNNFWNWTGFTLMLTTAVISFFKRRYAPWFLFTLFLFSAFGLLLMSGYSFGWLVYYGPVVKNLFIIQGVTISFTYILIFLGYKYIKYLKNYWFPVMIIFSYGFDFILSILRASYISGKYYFGILVDVYRFVGIKGNLKGLEWVNEDLPNYLSLGLLKVDMNKIYDNLYLYFSVLPLIHIIAGFLLYQIYIRMPKAGKKFMIVVLLLFYFAFIVNLIKTDPRVVMVE